MDKKYWLASIGTLAAVDIWAAYIKKDGTLSQAGREFFHTDTKTGKILWVASWAGLTAWLVPHVLKQVDDLANEIS